jgi:hypothetical protein
MKNVIKSMSILGIALLFLFVPVYGSAKPAPSPDHPAYLHALSDLRDARAHLQRPNGGELRDQEKKAIHEIDDAIDETKKASIDDGKDINEHAPIDSSLDWRGRLHKSLELVDKAHKDVSQEEDNSFAQGLQQRALDHIDKAHHHIVEAIQVVQ